MQEAGRVQAAIELSDMVWNFNTNEELTVRGYMKAHRYIGSTDRREITAFFWDTARRLGRLRALDSSLTPRKAAAASLFYNEKSRADVRAIFSGEKFAPFALTADESAFLDSLPPRLPDISFECPEFLRSKLSADSLTAMSAPAFLDLRVNTLKTDRGYVLKLLEKEGISAQKTPLSPWGVRVFNRPDLRRHDIILNGLADVQDEGSQLAALLSGARCDETVIDWCAGAGGKTLALSAMMQNKGRLDAADFYPHRMKDLDTRLTRAGCENVTVLDKYPDAPESYDLVFADAPCSGTGTWRRAPFMKWRTTPESVAEIVRVQQIVLNNAAPFVKKGGRLIYVTCSLLREENDAQIERFLAEHKDFVLNDLSADFYRITAQKTVGKTVTLFPETFGTDGFFIASLQKI